MSVVVEPVLTEEKLRALLAEGHEQSALDYKRQLDLSERRDMVELAKDVAAIQSEESGGYIVVGADDYGNVVSDVTSEQAKLFDEATVRAKLKKYIAEPFDIRVAVHAIDNCQVGLVYVAPSRGGWCIFVADGVYSETPAAGGGKPKSTTVFRRGDVFVRHGTASERWQPADVPRLLARVIAREKEAWRAELRGELSAMTNVGLSAQQLVQLPSSAVTWQLDAEGFDQLVTELMRREDDIPLRRLLMQIKADASTLLTDLEELATLLDRLAGFAALALTFERSAWFARSLATFVTIYESGFDLRGFDRRDVEVARLWLYIIARVEALGGLAVRLQDWPAVRALADRLPRGYDFERHYAGWLRHGLTMAARAHILEDEQNAGLIARAHNIVRGVNALHPDVDADSELVLNSLCQFDALAALVILGARGDTHRSPYYPSFARYMSERTVPALHEIVTDQAMRSELFDGDNELLAKAIKDINDTAKREGFNYNSWFGIEKASVADFLNRNLKDA